MKKIILIIIGILLMGASPVIPIANQNYTTMSCKQEWQGPNHMTIVYPNDLRCDKASKTYNKDIMCPTIILLCDNCKCEDNKKEK